MVPPISDLRSKATPFTRPTEPGNLYSGYRIRRKLQGLIA